MVYPDERIGHKIIVGEDRMEVKVCWDDKMYNSTNWTPDPMMTTVPILFSQILLQLFVSSILLLFLKPLKQPRLVAEILGGIVIGPTMFLHFFPQFRSIFPLKSSTVMENSMAFGITYYMFLVGLEMNLTPMLKIRRKMMINTIIGMILPLVVGFCSYFLIMPPMNPGDAVFPKLRNAFVWAIVLSSTNLPELTGILADLKLLRTDIGRTAVASSYVNDIATWFFLMILISVSSKGHVLRMCMSTAFLILFSMFLARPSLSWLISKTTKGQECKETHMHFILYGVLVSAFITDAMGLGSVVGAFLFGFSLPSGELSSHITERIGKVATWVMVPLYCLVDGLKTSVFVMIPKGRTAWDVFLFIVIAWATKVVSAFLVSALKSKTRRPREIFTLGVLMNSKGLLALVVINTGRYRHLVDIEVSMVMVISILVMMISIPPIIKYVYNPNNHLLRHKIRTIEGAGSVTNFRIITCIHSAHQVQSLTSLLKMSNPTTRSKINAIGVHLVELTETSSTRMLIVEDACQTKDAHRHNATDLNPVMKAMEEFGKANNARILVECQTVISPYTTMHVDICSIANDKQAAFLILPFHEQVNATDKSKEKGCHSIRTVNQHVLANPPCSIGLLVDCGLGNSSKEMRFIVMFFVGGPDDREAMTYAWRMVSGPNVHLTVIRFIPGPGAVELIPSDEIDESQGILDRLDQNYSSQKELDDEFIGQFKSKMEANQFVSYSEKAVDDGEGTMTIIKNVIEKNDYQLCIVGKGNDRNSPIESGLSDLVEYQELGPIGDAIVTSQFSKTTSVLVIHRYKSSRCENSNTK